MRAFQIEYFIFKCQCQRFCEIFLMDDEERRCVSYIFCPNDNRFSMIRSVEKYTKFSLIETSEEKKTSLILHEPRGCNGFCDAVSMYKYFLIKFLVTSRFIIQINKFSIGRPTFFSSQHQQTHYEHLIRFKVRRSSYLRRSKNGISEKIRRMRKNDLNLVKNCNENIFLN